MQYKIYITERSKSATDIEEDLNELAEEGWRVVCADGKYGFLLEKNN